MKNELISIIVPVYNQINYIDKCITSLIDQTYENIEIILVDDGSYDGSEKKCDEYSLIDKRIKVIHQSNKGVSCARNTGISQSKGEFLAFIDSDDYVSNDYVLLLYQAICKGNCDIAMCDFVEIDAEDNILSQEKSLLTNIKNTHDLLISEWNSPHTNVSCVVVWNKLFRRDLFDNIRFENDIHEDEILFNELIVLDKKVVFIDNVLYYYLQRSNSLIHQKYKINRTKFLDCLSFRINILRKKNEESVLNKALDVYMDVYIDLYNKLDEEDKKVLINSYKYKYYSHMKKYEKSYNLKNYFRHLLFYINPYLYFKFLELKNNK